MTGATTGAMPLTTMRGEGPGHGGAGEQVPHDGPCQDRARGRTQRLQYPTGDQVADGGRQRAPQRPRQVQRHTGKQRAAPARRVRQWTDDHLEEGQADDERREGHPDQRRAGVQLVSHARHGGQVHADRECTEGAQRAEDQGQPHPAPQVHRLQ